MERKQVWLEPEDIDLVRSYSVVSSPLGKLARRLAAQLEVPPAEMPAGRELDRIVCWYLGAHDDDIAVHSCAPWSRDDVWEGAAKRRLHERGIYVMAGYDWNGHAKAYLAYGGVAGVLSGDTPSHAVARLIAQLAQESE